MGNTDRRGPDISEGWQGASDDGADPGRALKVAVIGAGVAGLGKTDQIGAAAVATAAADTCLVAPVTAGRGVNTRQEGPQSYRSSFQIISCMYLL